MLSACRAANEAGAAELEVAHAEARAQGWRRASREPSLADVFGTIRTRPTGPLWKKLLAFLGPGYLVAVGYMDPGNWATSLAGGSCFGCALLFVVVASSGMAMLFQAAAVRLGLAGGTDLAQACRKSLGPRTALSLWLFCEVAIVACNLAEVLGMAIGLNLLLG